MNIDDQVREIEDINRDIEDLHRRRRQAVEQMGQIQLADGKTVRDLDDFDRLDAELDNQDRDVDDSTNLARNIAQKAKSIAEANPGGDQSKDRIW